MNYYLTVENETPENKSKINQINQHIHNKKPAVIYFYKNGCPFCERTTPEWKKLPNYLSQNKDLLVVDINKDYYEQLQSVGEKPVLYPNIRYVHGSHIDTFKKEGNERNAKNLATWIQQQPIHLLQEPLEEPLQKPLEEIYQSSSSSLRQQPYKSFPLKRLHKKPKSKKYFRKKKYNKHNKFTKRKRRKYYM
jgi:thiol-disulfide isomerase/thioredoxin